jgi:uncharacterized protein (TIGR03000 family)
MNTLRSSLALAALTALLAPATAHAQFGLYPWGGYGFGGFSPYGYGYGGYSPYGYGGWGYPWGGGFVTGPRYFYSGAYIPPVVAYSTPAVGYVAETASTPPRMRPTVNPAIPYRDEAVGDSRAHLDVRVPTASAELWFDGVRMQQSGLDRSFVTPPLQPGSAYTFELRVSWLDAAGKQQTRTRRVDVRAGEQQSVDFLSGP